MAITKINTPELLDINTTGAKQLPSGTTAQRPATGLTAGDFRYNTDDNYVEYYDGSAWFQIDYEAAAATCTTDTINYPSGTTNTAYYKMSDATDSTLNGYNGTATSVDFNVQGKFGNAGSFNGSSSRIATGLTLPADSTMSFSFWLKSASNSSGNNYFFSDFDSSANDNSSRLSLAVTPNNGFRIWMSNGSSNWNSTDAISLSSYVNVWTNLVVTLDGTTVKVYINGGTPTTLTSTVAFGTAGSRQQTIGRAGDLNGAYYEGSIDQVRIFDTEITADNVTSLYNEVQCVPAIIPSDYFNPLLYNGNNNTQSIDDLTFAPDLVWIKSRSNSTSNELNDSVRGQVSRLFSDSTSAQGTIANGFLSLDSNGFSLNNAGNGGEVNGLNRTYVAWNWKAGGAPTATNSAGAGNVPTAGSVKIDGADSTTALAGTIAATSISANTDAGFSIVEWSSSGVLATVGHGLDSAPELIIGKGINWSSSWPVYALPVGNNKKMSLNDSIEAHTSTIWGNTTPTTTTFNQDFTGTTNRTSIAYCFHSVDGYSDIGSYIGTNAPNNTIVTGFRPAYLMIKLTSAANGNWIIFDNKRNTSNPLTDVLKADDAGAETTEAALNIDFLSNGFTLNGAAGAGGTGQINSIGETYIYLAIAEQVYNANAVTANQTNPFNDGSQVAQYEFEDNADDSQPNGYIGKGGTFNGSTSNIDTNLSLNSLTDYTISLWLNPTGGAFFGGTINSSAKNGFYFQYSSTVPNTVYWVEVNASAVVSNLTITGAVNDGSWNHIVFVRNGGTNYIYVNNGTPVSVSNGSYTHATDFILGKAGDFATAPITGSIDQVRIYDTALNPNDVSLLYSETSVTSSTLDYPASTGAIALYELEGDATSTSSSTYDGAATSVDWVPLYDGTPTVMQYSAPSVSTPFLKAGDFNGSSSYIDLGNNSSNNSSLISISCWLNTTTTASESTIFNNGGNDSTSTGLSLVVTSSGILRFNTNNSISGSFGQSFGTTVVNDGNWHNIVVSYNSGTLNLYLDGNTTPEMTSTSHIFTTTASRNFIIGRFARTTLYYLDGSIDQFRIFNKALDSGEVLQLYNEPNN